MNIAIDDQTAADASRFFLGESLTPFHMKRLLDLAERCTYFEWRLGLLPDRNPDWKERLDEIAQRASVPDRTPEHKAYLASLDREPK